MFWYNLGMTLEFKSFTSPKIKATQEEILEVRRKASEQGKDPDEAERDFLMEIEKSNNDAEFEAELGFTSSRKQYPPKEGGYFDSGHQQ